MRRLLLCAVMVLFSSLLAVARTPGWEAYVGLSPQQHAQVVPMRKSLRSQTRLLRRQEMGQIKSVLSPSQYVQFKTMRARARARHERLPRGWEKSLGVTQPQSQRLSTIFRQTRQTLRSLDSGFFAQVQPILTADQRTRLGEYRQSRTRR